MGTDLSVIATMINSRFDGVETRLAAVEQRLEQVIKTPAQSDKFITRQRVTDFVAGGTAIFGLFKLIAWMVVTPHVP